MKKTTLACALMIIATYSADAYGLYLYNRSGGTLCAAATRDVIYDNTPDRITNGWNCVDDFGTLEIERSDGMLDVAVKRADGTDYVASSTLAFSKTKSFVPKDETIAVFGVEVVTFPNGVAYSWVLGPGGEWASYQSVREAKDLPATLDALGFKQFEAWQIDAQHNGLGYILQ